MKILCYGDSLTAGFSMLGMHFTPYGETIGSRLMMDGISSGSVTSIGMSGWTTGDMIAGLECSKNVDLCGNEGPGLVRLLEEGHYDVVCLMAGTNDIGTGVDEEEIFGNLKNLSNISMEKGGSASKTVLLSIPPIGAEGRATWIKTKRDIINQGIQRFVEQNSPRMVFIDAASQLPNPGSHSGSSSESELWDRDLLHLSPKGYETLGNFVYTECKRLGIILKP
mmetsp:Transcript_14074/g.23411  ORF Transcript_14074/g.23411 Transcript_14074/m.23411 type:complete len:223 (-) Transcript_14074:1740-2408(-)